MDNKTLDAKIDKWWCSQFTDYKMKRIHGHKFIPEPAYLDEKFRQCKNGKTKIDYELDLDWKTDFDTIEWDRDTIGDVLISWTNKPFIYNGFFNESVVGAYCGLNTFNRIIIADKQDYLYYDWTIKKDVRPATKEQRDFLFKKIKDKGYEWDNEKKELIRRT